MSKKSKNKHRGSITKSLLIIFTTFVLAILIYPKIFSVPCANSLSCGESFNFKVENNSVAIFENHKISAPNITNSMLAGLPNVLGDSTSQGEKHIYVDLTNQRLYAYLGTTLVLQTFVSTGKWHPTPTGDFTIWEKVRSTRMSGGSGDDYYNLPNVPFVMFFYNQIVPKAAGFSFHGAYWHDNFGHAMSHGCVNMRISDAEKLYAWADPTISGNIAFASDNNQGTKVTIFGEAP